VYRSLHVLVFKLVLVLPDEWIFLVFLRIFSLVFRTWISTMEFVRMFGFDQEIGNSFAVGGLLTG